MNTTMEDILKFHFCYNNQIDYHTLREMVYKANKTTIKIKELYLFYSEYLERYYSDKFEWIGKRCSHNPVILKKKKEKRRIKKFINNKVYKYKIRRN